MACACSLLCSKGGASHPADPTDIILASQNTRRTCVSGYYLLHNLIYYMKDLIVLEMY
jgi:hypothetical protein